MRRPSAGLAMPSIDGEGLRLALAIDSLYSLGRSIEDHKTNL